MEPTVKLVSWSTYPIETIYHLWEASRTNEPVDEPSVLAVKANTLPLLKSRIRETFEKVVASGIPVAENLWFVFLLDGVSVSFREQMVRHRIGVKVGERLGSDLVPDLHDSTWWSQSMRVLDMGRFADEGKFRTPPAVAASPEMKAVFEAGMVNAQEIYNRLVGAGIPNEDAREVIPLGATHRISWGLNLAAIQHIVSKRSCWILQLGLWEPVIKGIVRELAEKIDPIFYKLSTPPCIKGEKFKSCPFVLDNEKRIAREDPLPACSLFLHNHGVPAQAIFESEGRPDFVKMQDDYEKFWGRNPKTGALIANPKS